MTELQRLMQLADEYAHELRGVGRAPKAAAKFQNAARSALEAALREALAETERMRAKLALLPD